MLAGWEPSTRLTDYRGSNALMPQAALKNIPRIICYHDSPGFLSQQQHHSSQRECDPTDQPNSSQCYFIDLKRQRKCCFLRETAMLLAPKFLCFSRRQILGKMSITLHVLQPPQEPLSSSILLACRALEKNPLALTVENRDVIGVTGTITMQSLTPSAGTGSWTSIFFPPQRGMNPHLYTNYQSIL